MKKSNIFLGTTTCILAVSAVAATKIKKSFSDAVRYYCTNVTTPLHSHCVPYELSNWESQPGGTKTCYFTVTSGGVTKKYILYTNLGNPTTPTCAGTGGLNCTNKVKYTTWVD